MSNEIHLLVIDDHSLFREGLIRLLAAENDFRIVGNCAHLREAKEILDNQQVDVVLLDFDLETEQGSRLLAEISHRETRPRVLMVTAGMSSNGMRSVLEQGASGIFLKHSSPSQLAEAIRRVMDGEMWLDPRTVKPVVESTFSNPREDSSRSSLSSREKAVLKNILEGASNKKIADTLHLSESSVKAILQQLFAKTGVRSRSQLVRLAIERHSHDWLDDELD
ncbi:MAG TPA: response regulator transcription factor [Terracidiphilus sp.]|nr:response regulator transcription factor [Terracidiphilus sp.]HEV2398008.1 response regulator transcription factor [Candidatus Sulfotelmatobacter sp.]